MPNKGKYDKDVEAKCRCCCQDDSNGTLHGSGGAQERRGWLGSAVR
jgi:hypothetical protein